MRVEYTAPREVHEAIASLGRTEDARFSLDGKRLAVAAFLNNRIALFEIEMCTEAQRKTVTLSAVSILDSPELKSPHGLDFIDNQTLVVANRKGGVQLYRLPRADITQACRKLTISALACIESDLLDAPGSVAACRGDTNHCEILVCNNSGNSVTRHLIDSSCPPAVKEHQVLLSKWLEIPDGISVSQINRLIAVSNHMLHSVMLYDNTSALQPESNPLGVLCGAHYPHGVRISADDRHIFVADAGAPFVYIYARQNTNWQGVHYPQHRLRVMDETLFQTDRHNPQEGGPKGLDVDKANGILVTTCGSQNLAFFNIENMIASSPVAAPADSDPALAAVDVRYELERQSRHAEANSSAVKLQELLSSRSWRLTSLLHRGLSALKRAN